jgi:hypothetical protein
MVGLAFGFGRGSRAEEGAFAPTAGTGRVSVCGGAASAVAVSGADSGFEVMVGAYTLYHEQ